MIIVHIFVNCVLALHMYTAFCVTKIIFSGYKVPGICEGMASAESLLARGQGKVKSHSTGEPPPDGTADR